MFYIYEKDGLLYGTTKEIKQEGFNLVDEDGYGRGFYEKDVPFKTGAFDKGTAPYGCREGATIKIVKGRVLYRDDFTGGWSEKIDLFNARTGEYLENGEIKTFFVA